MRRTAWSVLGLAWAFAFLAQPAVGQMEQNREGFWFNVGLGWGTLGCNDCDGREGALTGVVSVGGTLNNKVLLGVGTNGWAKTGRTGATLFVGTVTAQIRYYTSATGGFFLTGGVGMGGIDLYSPAPGEMGVGILLGLGYDFRVGRNVSLTPYSNGFAVKAGAADASVGQIGLGVTIH